MAPSTLPREAETKGTNLLGSLRSLREERGAAMHDSAVAAAQGAFGEALRSGHLLPVGWYPVSWYVELHRAIESAAGGGVTLVRRLATVTTERDFSGLHRLVVRVLSPQTAARHTHRMLQLYWRGGSVEVVEDREGLVRLRLRGWIGFTPSVWEDLAGSIESVLGVVGARAPRARVASMSPDRSDAEIEARFGA